MKIELLWVTPDAEKHIEDAGRTSYLSFDKKSADSAGKFIRMLIGFGHESVIEHASASFRISGISRVTSHQIVRHRLASYTQQSQRYVDETGFNWIIPPSIKEDKEATEFFMRAMKNTEHMYDELQLHRNIPKEDARYVLPNACETQLVMTANFREWRHFCKLRGSMSAQWEIRKIAMDVLCALQVDAPNVFYDLKIVKTPQGEYIEKVKNL